MTYPQPPPWQDPNRPQSGPPFQPQSGMPYSPAPYGQQMPMPYSPGPYPIQQPQQVVVVKGPDTSSYAIVSLVLSILGLVSSCCTFGFFSLLGVAFGHAALYDVKHNGKGGQGIAMAGTVLGYIVAGPAIFLSVMFIFGGWMSALEGNAP